MLFSLRLYIFQGLPGDSVAHHPHSGMQTERVSTREGGYLPWRGEGSRADHSPAFHTAEGTTSFLLTFNSPKDMPESKGLRGTIPPFARVR